MLVLNSLNGCPDKFMNKKSFSVQVQLVYNSDENGWKAIKKYC